MRTEIKTAIVIGIVIVLAVAGLGTYFNSLDSTSTQITPDLEKMSSGNSTLVSSIDKSGFKKAPNLSGIADYINTTPEELKKSMENKVILYDIWTYSCINCQRTLPYITAWNDKYADKGLLIIGIHSPEFEFEKDINNVKMAVDKFGIKYPVVLDNDMQTWKAFDNRYWPRKFIADAEGYIRYDHIGEGGYMETEKVIQNLLQERAQMLGINVSSTESLVKIQEQISESQTPELYFGYNFAFGRNQLGNAEGFRPEQIVAYSLPDKLKENFFYLDGQWQNLGDRMKLVSENGKIVLPYFAKSVNIVAGNESELDITLDGKSLTEESGMDVHDGKVHILENRLYNIISTKSAGSHTLTIKATHDFEIYTFTFG